MTFLELVDEVMNDRFSESKRENIERWINSRYGRLWAKEPWSFKQIIVTHPFTVGTSTVSLDTLGLQRVEAVWSGLTNSYGTVYADRPEDFHAWASTQNGKPYGFTVIGGTLRLERPVSTATTFTILGESKFTPLVNDNDEPLIPEEFHYALVHGASSEGLRLENDPTWQGFEQDWLANIEDMKSGYLVAVRASGDRFPAWPYSY